MQDPYAFAAPMSGYGPPPVQQYPYPMMPYDVTQGYGMPPAQFGVQQGYPMPGMAVAPPPPGEDNPDLYIPDIVKQFITHFYNQVMEKNMEEILKLYENDFRRLSERWFTEFPWPEAERIAQFVNNEEFFLILYKELYFRHIYAHHQPSIDHRFDSYYNYCDLFEKILNSDKPLPYELPNQWLWDIIDEFLYQFQSFVQFRSKLKARTTEEIETLKANPKVWSIHSVLNVLYSLARVSRINQQLEVFQKGLDPSEVAGDFGSHSLYKNLGYFSLIGLLRLHTQLGDYYNALDSVKNVTISKKVLANTRVPASQIALYYYVGFCYLMMRRYQDTIRVFSHIIVFIQRAKQHFPPKSYQYDQVVKQNDQMLMILAMVLTLCPQHVDESVSTQLKQEKHAEKIAKLQKGDKSTYAEIFKWACPKFILPIPPIYEGLPENYNKEATNQQCEIFVCEIEQQLFLPTIKSYLKFYTTMPMQKLAAFMDENVDKLTEQLLCFKHKTKCLVCTAKGINPLSGELQLASDLDFYIDGDMIHTADTKVARRYGDFFIRQIQKLDEILAQGRRKLPTAH